VFKKIEPDPVSLNLKLRVDLSSGDSCIKYFNKIAQVLAKPKPQIAISKKNFCNVSESFVLTDNTPKSAFRIWLIEGKSYPMSSKSFTGNFTSLGKKSVVIMVEDSLGCRTVESFPDFVQVLDNQYFEIIADEVISCVDIPVQFSLNSGVSPRDVTSINWKFPGADIDSFDTWKPPAVAYDQPGQKDVSVQITTTKGCTYDVFGKKVTNIITPLELEVEIADSAICLPAEVLVQIMNKNLDGPITWKVEGLPMIDSFSPTIRKFHFMIAGDHALEIEYEGEFCVSRYVKKPFVSAKRLIAQFSATQYYDCEVPFTSIFKNISSSSETGKINYHWSVYDSTGKLLDSASTKDYSFVVSQFGNYDISLRAQQEGGCTDVAYHSEFIRADSIRPDYSALPNLACLNQQVLLQNTSLPSTFRSSDFFSWYVFRHGDTIAFDSSKFKQPVFYAKYKGSYDVLVKVWNSSGCTQTDLRENAFEVIEPKAGFILEQDTVCASEAIHLTSQINPPKGDYQHRWLISNQVDTSEILYESEIYFTMPNPGVYDVSYDISIYEQCRDTLIKENELVVSGISVDIVLPTHGACRNLAYTPTDTIRNIIFGSTPKTIKRTWSVSPSDEVTITNGNSANPEFYFAQNGRYVFQLIVENGNSCKDTAISDTVFVGLSPSITFIDSFVCANTAMNFINRTDSYANRWFHKLSPSASYSVSDLTKDSGQVSIGKNGSYQLDIIASRDSFCFDTLSFNLDIVTPTADFHTLDSNLYCAPAYQRFRSTSTYADTLFWDFGDGNKHTSTDHRVTTVYLKNTGSKSAYTVGLIAKNKTGCADTIEYEDLVQISGPVANYTLNINRGCEPLDVTLVGDTQNVAKLFIDFGDGTDFGYALNQPHSYYNQWRILEQVYKPVVLIVDKNGCVNAVKSDSSVYVKPSPIARIGMLDSIGCAPLTSRYFYLGDGGKTWYWDFDGNGVADGSNAAGKYTFFNPGTYDMTLVNENSFKCIDTAVFKVKVIAPPEIKFMHDSIGCINKTLTLADTSILNLPIKTRKWDVTSNGATQSYSDSIVTFVPASSELYTIKLSLTDTFGCRAEGEEQVSIRDSSDIEDAGIEVVSVLNNDSVEISVTPTSRAYFQTKLFHKINTSFDEISRHPHARLRTIDSLSVPASQSVCYEVQHLDECEFTGKSLPMHCTILLEGENIGPGAVNLHWSAYIGWNNIALYRLYRSGSSGQELIATLNSSTLSYVDSGLCETDYCYFVEAFEDVKKLTSRSNSICLPSLYIGNVDLVDVVNVTVNGQKAVQVDLSPAKALSTYVLSKYIGNSYIGDVEFTSTSYLDVDVKVDEHSYSYVAQTLDFCELVSEKGQFGNSILLQLDKSDSLYLNWSKYRTWKDGVESYTIYQGSKDELLPAMKLSGTDTKATIPIDDKISAANCYLIEAVNANSSLKSRSNIRCLETSVVVYIPNAFYPGSNHGNNKFRPSVWFAKNPLEYEDGLYSLQIFDRWGGLIFATNQIEDSWDGSHFGKAAPAGAYFYTLRLNGLDNKIKNYSGLLTLYR